MRFQVLRAFLGASGVQFGHAIGEKRPENALGNLECMELPKKQKKKKKENDKKKNHFNRLFWFFWVFFFKIYFLKIIFVDLGIP